MLDGRLFTRPRILSLTKIVSYSDIVLFIRTVIIKTSSYERKKVFISYQNKMNLLKIPEQINGPNNLKIV